MRSEGLQIITEGSTATVSNGVRDVFIDPGSLLASMSLTLPAAPSDRDEIRIFFGGTIATGAAVVTVLSMLQTQVMLLLLHS